MQFGRRGLVIVDVPDRTNKEVCPNANLPNADEWQIQMPLPFRIFASCVYTTAPVTESSKTELS